MRDLSRLYGDGPELEATFSPARAQEYSDGFAKHYLHGVPFDPARLLEVWSKCRERPRGLEECQALVAADPTAGPPGSASADALLRQCRTELAAGPRCRAGHEAARLLVETGSTAPAR